MKKTIVFMTPRRWEVIVTAVALVYSQVSPSFQAFLSSNMTIAKYAEDNKMPVTLTVGLGIVLLGILVYLFMSDGRHSDTKGLEDKLDTLISEIRADRLSRMGGGEHDKSDADNKPKQ